MPKSPNTMKKRFKTIVLRGCLIRVPLAKAKELERLEQKEAAKDWAKNQVD